MDTSERIRKLRVLESYLQAQLEQGGISEPARVASQYRQVLAELEGLERPAPKQGESTCRCTTIAAALNYAYDEMETRPDFRLDWTESVRSPDFVERVVGYVSRLGRLQEMQSAVHGRRTLYRA